MKIVMELLRYPEYLKSDQETFNAGLRPKFLVSLDPIRKKLWLYVGLSPKHSYWKPKEPMF